MTASPADAPVLAFDVGGTTIKAEVIAGDRTLAAERRPTPPGAAALDAIADLGTTLMRTTDVAAAGVAVRGLVDRKRGVGIFSANIGWRDLPIAAPLTQRWKLPVRVDHDVTMAGWAEWRRGAGRGVADLVYLSLGTGISAAIVSGGRLVRGGAGQAGEVGHVVVDPDGPDCGCGGRGCLEAVASAAAIRREYERRSGQPVDGAEAVLARVATDPTAAAVVDRAVAALGDGLAALVQLLAPARIVVGGGLAMAGDSLLEPLRAVLTGRCRVVAAPEVVTAELGARAGVVGAALLGCQALADAGGGVPGDPAVESGDPAASQRSAVEDVP